MPASCHRSAMQPRRKERSSANAPPETSNIDLRRHEKSTKIASKIDLTNHKKMIPFYIASKLIFGGFWPPTSTSKGVQRNGFWSSWGGLELSWGQDGPKTYPRGPWDCFLLIFGQIFVDFWTEICQFLDRL